MDIVLLPRMSDKEVFDYVSTSRVFTTS